MENESTITCPHCNFKMKEKMPVDRCVWSYVCTNCKSVLQAKPGQCCIFCSYGDTPCPPKQGETSVFQ